jgi:hypothetical protein
MTIKRFKKLNFNDDEVSRFQENVAQSIDSITFSPIIDGIILHNVPIVIGDNIINHKLQRDLTGWVIILKDTAANIYDKQNEITRKELFLKLNSDAVTTVDIWVF